LLVEQNASLALQYSRYVYVLEEGTITDQGLSADLATKRSIVRAYLGMA